MTCGDHFPCWCLAELCVGLCFRVHLLSFNDGRVRVHPLSFHWWAKLITSRNCLFHVFCLNKEFFSNYFGQCLEWFHRKNVTIKCEDGPCLYTRLFLDFWSLMSFYILQFTNFFTIYHLQFYNFYIRSHFYRYRN